MMIETDEEMIVTGEASTGKEAIDFCESQLFDVAILDIRMPEMDGIKAAKIMRTRWPELKILMLTTFDDSQYVMDSLKIGVSGYLLKNADTDALIRSIRSGLTGGLTIEEKAAAKVMPLLLNRQQEIKADPSLTPREQEILRCIGEGMSNNEIAERLALSVGTIKNNISNVLNKLDLRDRTQLAIYAIRHNLV
jgi:DNA-binding NarL/FixJ family response regulator